MQLRPPAVAGIFYPENPDKLRNVIRKFVEAGAPSSRVPAKAIIAPHAGYAYSGPIAGSAYRSIAPIRDSINRVVLIGPAHRVHVPGIALSSSQCFATPLGNVPVDQLACGQLRRLEQIVVHDAAHAPEHGLEVHLPFLQVELDAFQIVPLLVGDTTGEEVAEVLDLLWGGDETLIVISSDLSHFLDYESARALDGQTAKAIEALRPQDIRPDQACGQLAINGLLALAAKRNLRAGCVNLRNSGDTSGSRDSVVGYGAFVL